MKTIKLIPAVVLVFLTMPALAQAAVPEVSRDVKQQQRIESGLKSGQLTTREVARLERAESRIDRTQAKVLKDGTVTDAEKTRLQHMQNSASRDIKAQKHDAQTGNPNSASSQRMQSGVQRNINQEKRIDNGLKNGTLTNREAARLERRQAKIKRMEARAGRDGHVGAGEQRRIQRAENRQSRRIHRQRHDAQRTN